ncbi:aromatic prenyltransferase [Aspergillus aurantiobrunneus]
MAPINGVSQETIPFSSLAMARTSSPAFQVLSEYLTFADTNQSQWWLDSGSLLARMLQLGQYSTQEQYRHLLFFYRHILPFFGPYPPTWTSIATRSGLSADFSLNFQKSANPVIRMAFEALNYESGTPKDPFNKIPAAQLLAGVAKHGLKHFDTALFDHFAESLFISDAEVGENPNLDAHPIKTHTILAFDFRGDSPLIKVYARPRWKSMASGIPVGQLIKDSVGKIKDQIHCTEAFALVDSYMDERKFYDLRTFVAWDCTPIQKFRMKIYGVHNSVSLSQVEDAWTLGGRLTDAAALEGLNLIRRLWALLDINRSPHQRKEDDELLVDYGSTQEVLPLFWNYEVNSGSSRVSPKIYFPVYGESDLEVAVALSKFFEVLGWQDKADTYVDSVRALFPGLDISKTTRLQQLISFAYIHEKGPYLSVYYHATTSYPMPGQVE